MRRAVAQEQRKRGAHQTELSSRGSANLLANVVPVQDSQPELPFLNLISIEKCSRVVVAWDLGQRPPGPENASVLPSPAPTLKLDQLDRGPTLAFIK
jgi:hypothetical protein